MVRGRATTPRECLRGERGGGVRINYEWEGIIRLPVKSYRSQTHASVEGRAAGFIANSSEK